MEIFKTINIRRPLNIAFRSCDAYYYPSLPQSTAVLWNVKLASENKRPQSLLLAFRNNKNKFVHCDLTDIKVHLNFDVYPYDDLNLKFDRNRFAAWFDIYSKFQQSFYLRDSQPLLTRERFKTTAPIILIDLSHQNEATKTGPIDTRKEIKIVTNIPTNVIQLYTMECLNIFPLQMR